ncbi:MAG TPA: hypothetical protein VK745_13170 [Polyangiaceae bacterium]|jgi:predicted lipoprotein with Yx(FWY)xxD motif|nr:hypothetical protein [Polyangiaceae bacterium]
MPRDRSLVGLAALLGLIAAQACSSDSTSDDGASAGAAGQTSSSAGTSSSVAGTGSAQAGSWGASGSSTSNAGAAGSSAGAAGSASSGSSTGGGTGGAGGAGSDTFTSHTSTVGTVLVTTAGRTLYFYQPDTPAAGATAAISACTGTCLTHWPLYYGNPVSVTPELQASDFGSFDRGGGVMQSTYHGWPVYMYDDDKVAGDAKGDMEKNTMGKVVWYAVKIPFSSGPPKP